MLAGAIPLRLVSRRLPKPWLLGLCRVAIPLYHVHRLPVLGAVTRVLVPTNMHPSAEWRWLDTFDWSSPRYQWKHSYEEVEMWFREAGLIDVRRGSFPVSVVGRRSSIASSADL